MKVLTWIPHGLLIIVFSFAGFTKLAFSSAELLEMGMGYVELFSPMMIKFVGVCEVLGSLGLLLPMIIKKYQFFVPISAAGFGLIMVAASITHLLRSEPIYVIMNVILLVLTVIVFNGTRHFFKREKGDVREFDID